MLTYISIATPTAPPNTTIISLPTLPVRVATPVCRPGAPGLVPVAAPAPAVPLGGASSAPGAGTTVTAVTVLLLPSARVVVRREVVVWEDWVFLPAAALLVVAVCAALLEGCKVRTPPPTVETMVTPSAFVVVTTCPGVRVPAAAADVVVVSAALAGVLPPAATGDVLVVVTDPGALADEAGAFADVVVVSELPPCGTGVTDVLEVTPATGLVLVEGPAGAGTTLDVPLLGVWRLARETMLEAREASSR